MKDDNSNISENAEFWLNQARKTSLEIRRVLTSQAFNYAQEQGKAALVAYALEKLQSMDVQVSCAFDYITEDSEKEQK